MGPTKEQVENIEIEKIAEFVIAFFNVNDIEITNLRLQKILYYIQAWHLVYFDSPLFTDEPEAWVNGPVYKKVYNLYKEYGRNPIFLADSEEETLEIFNYLKDNLNINDKQFRFLSAIFEKYGMMSLGRLLHRVHVERPWNEARKDVKAFEFSDNIISLDSMKRYYSSLVK